jgi:hypothetical protein
MANASSIQNNLDCLAEVFIFSVIVSQALLISTSVSKSSKAANLFDTSTRNCSLSSTSVVLKEVGTAPLGAVRGTQWAVTAFWAAGGCFIQKFDGCRKATVLGGFMTSLILLWSFVKERILCSVKN